MGERSLSFLGAGVGFVGRHLTTFLVTNQLCSKVRVVDKVPPATAWLNEEHKVSAVGEDRAVGGESA